MRNPEFNPRNLINLIPNLIKVAPESLNVIRFNRPDNDNLLHKSSLKKGGFKVKSVPEENKNFAFVPEINIKKNPFPNNPSLSAGAVNKNLINEKENLPLMPFILGSKNYLPNIINIDENYSFISKQLTEENRKSFYIYTSDDESLRIEKQLKAKVLEDKDFNIEAFECFNKFEIIIRSNGREQLKQNSVLFITREGFREILANTFEKKTPFLTYFKKVYYLCFEGETMEYLEASDAFSLSNIEFINNEGFMYLDLKKLFFI